jgi:uncharacterized protein YbbC (DUF1343 family)
VVKIEKMIGFVFRWILILTSVTILVTAGTCHAQSDQNSTLKTGAGQPELYLPFLEGKSVALLVNQTSTVRNVHLIDFLMSRGINVKQIFAAEHGIRGLADAGEHLAHGTDQNTGLPIISLHGDQKKPTAEQMEGIDIVLFDVQDVGCRFFTYISTMHYLMEACAENGKTIIVLDRPNPNGDYIDGPVLDISLASFVGMHPIPIVHGCTIGELALMINGEKWLKNGIEADLKVIPVKNYNHTQRYSLPVKPSPNLPNDLSVRLYPSLCLFEATNVSIGRGTYFPFQVIAYPRAGFGNFAFTPVSIEGMSKDPLHLNTTCYGDDLRLLDNIPTFTLSFFLDCFKKVGDEKLFWKSRRWIDLLVGDPQFYQQVNQGWSEQEIRNTWAEGLENYSKIRKKYLIYPDFNK